MNPVHLGSDTQNQLRIPNSRNGKISIGQRIHLAVNSSIMSLKKDPVLGGICTLFLQLTYQVKSPQ